METLKDQTKITKKVIKLEKKRNKRLKSNLKTWTDVIIPQFEIKKSSKKFQSKLKAVCLDGIPPGIRVQVWPLLIGNSLQMSKELWSIFLKRSEGLNGTETFGEGKEPSLKLIKLDVPRTLSAMPQLHDIPHLEESLTSILKTYCCYRPDCGYIQGMTYLAMMVIIFVGNEYSSFQCFANLMNKHFYLDIFQKDFKKIHLHARFFGHYLEENHKLLHNHFEEIGITPEMYFFVWYMTVFMRAFPLEVVARLWDCFLVEGEVFLFKTAIGIIKLLEPTILKMDEMHEILQLLNKPDIIIEAILMDTIGNIKMSPRKFQEALFEFDKTHKENNIISEDSSNDGNDEEEDGLEDHSHDSSSLSNSKSTTNNNSWKMDHQVFYSHSNENTDDIIKFHKAEMELRLAQSPVSDWLNDDVEDEESYFEKEHEEKEKVIENQSTTLEVIYDESTKKSNKDSNVIESNSTSNNNEEDIDVEDRIDDLRISVNDCDDDEDECM
eukprot:TRINITY_DN604226_c0_g1_i1.p1 TRINITY_DN604226_c0_g1~~TRINITY_DN604226_c0_g1_i1.p1  ORF type:complete len:494 (-),score=127.66 TRINITY_DN604226_c0_g1_i1:437-1918(-)